MWLWDILVLWTKDPLDVWTYWPLDPWDSWTLGLWDLLHPLLPSLPPTFFYYLFLPPPTLVWYGGDVRQPQMTSEWHWVLTLWDFNVILFRKVLWVDLDQSLTISDIFIIFVDVNSQEMTSSFNYISNILTMVKMCILKVFSSLFSKCCHLPIPPLSLTKWCFCNISELFSPTEMFHPILET